jgi:SAM-dependent methyltransferase
LEGAQLKESDYIESNRRLWNEATGHHVRSELYAVEEFKLGKSSLHSIELDELGDVSGKSMLHLQCHFGLDTLSWARLGARVTGVDFSDESIACARRLSEEIAVHADFIRSNIYDLPEHLEGEFDIVFTSYGVLTWLPDLGRWAEVISHFLRREGAFYIADFHPFSRIFADDEDVRELVPGYPYFHSAEPLHFPPAPTYATKTKLSNPSYEWQQSMGDVINSLISNGLQIQFLHEFPFSYFRALPFMEQGKDGCWRLPGNREDVPLMFSLMAKKPAD